MAIIAREPESKYTPCPEGLHPAVCCDVIDLGLIEGQYGQKHKVKIRFDVRPEDGESYQMTKWYTLSLSEKANLRKDLETWRGRKFTAVELGGFDLEKLLGVNAQVQVVHAPGDDGKVYARVLSIIPASRHTPKLRIADDYVREQDRLTGFERFTDEKVDDEPIPF